MASKKHSKQRQKEPAGEDNASAAPEIHDRGVDQPSIRVAEEDGKIRAAWRPFPGPRGVAVPLRIVLDRAAFAEVTAHAHSSLDAEICGVLTGEVCEDSDGLFVHAHAAIRGTATSHGTAHVTFTQETWSAIHETLEKEHPKAQIIGWYHSHPGFGVAFSEMDLFIQKHFFPSATHFALVIDPLGGQVAICVNSENGPRYVDRFWIDGREHRAQLPAAAQHAVHETTAIGPQPMAEDLDQRYVTLETRVGQMMQVLDEQRTSFQRFMIAVWILVFIGFIATFGYSLYSKYTSKLEPPKLRQYIPIPIKIGPHTLLMGVEIVSWDVPPELNAIYQQLADAKQQEIAMQSTAVAITNQEAGGVPGQHRAVKPPDAPAAQQPAGNERRQREAGSTQGQAGPIKPPAAPAAPQPAVPEGEPPQVNIKPQQSGAAMPPVTDAVPQTLPSTTIEQNETR